MAFSIGQILIELALNATSFSQGLTSVTVQSQRAAKEIQGAFSEIGGTLSELLGQFGPLGSAIGQAFTGAAGAASKATTAFSGMGGEIGLLGASLGAVAGLTVAAGAGAIGLAAHASEGAAKLHELSEATGVNVETLSRYGYIARQSGVDSDTLTKGLEKLAKSAYAAAVAPAGAVNVYTRLGIAVKDADGALRPVSDIMADVSDKFEKMGPSTERTALAMQLFGRGGAAMLPALAGGSAELKKMSDEADAFGVTISGKTAEAAHQFEQSLDKISEAGTGVANQLMVQLLPTLQLVATQFVNALKDPDSGLRSTITVIGYVAEAIVALGELIVQVFKQAYNIIYGTIATLQEVTRTLIEQGKAALHLDWKGYIDASIKGGQNLAIAWKQTWDGMKGDAMDFGHTIAKIFSGAAAPSGPTKVTATPQPVAGGVVGTAASHEKDIVEALLDKLLAQQRAEEKISAIVADSAYDLAIKKAAAEADNKVEDTRNQLLERQAQLEKELVTAKGTKKEASVKTQIDDVKKYLEELKVAAPQIQALYYQMASEKEIASANEALRKQTMQVDAEAAAFKSLSESAFQSAAAQREAAAETAAAKYAAENPELATQERLRVVYDNALKQQDLAYQKTVLQAAVQDDLNKKYEDEMSRLNDVRNILVQNGKDTLVVDAQIYDAQQKINAEWDAAAIKVGDFKQAMAGTLDTLARQSENFGATFSKSIITGVDSATSALSKFLVTGSKTNFKQIGDSFMESITGGVLKTGVSKIAGGLLGKLGLGGLLPGGAGKPDGTQSNPMFVSLVDSSGLIGGGTLGAGGVDLSNFLGNGFGTSKNGPDTESSGGGILGSIFGGIGSFFGGFLAEGGDVMPGKAYMVGETRPELFVPDRPGKIIPDLTKMNKSGTGMQAQVTMHVHGVSDTDSFRKAGPQVAAELFRQLATAHARNGGQI